MFVFPVLVYFFQFSFHINFNSLMKFRSFRIPWQNMPKDHTRFLKLNMAHGNVKKKGINLTRSLIYCHFLQTTFEARKKGTGVLANFFNGVAIRTAALWIICLMLLIRTAAQYLIYITWSLAAISNYEWVVRWRLGRPLPDSWSKFTKCKEAFSKATSIQFCTVASCSR